MRIFHKLFFAFLVNSSFIVSMQDRQVSMSEWEYRPAATVFVPVYLYSKAKWEWVPAGKALDNVRDFPADNVGSYMPDYTPDSLKRLAALKVLEKSEIDKLDIKAELKAYLNILKHSSKFG